MPPNENRTPTTSDVPPSPPRAVVVVTGSELVRGDRRDLNGPFLARELLSRGYNGLVHALFRGIPTGVGARRKGEGVLEKGEEKKALVEGARWAIAKGWGWESDLERIEERGAIGGADPGRPQAVVFPSLVRDAGLELLSTELLPPQSHGYDITLFRLAARA